MNLLEGIKGNNTITNTKGSKYYKTTYNNNLDFFCGLSRHDSKEKIIDLFDKALSEDEDLALANLLYILDIRNGKGERRIFKTIFRYLCLSYPSLARKVLPFIKELGRYDYILEGIDTKVEQDVMLLIQKQLEADVNSSNPSLLAKWLPSHRTHNIDNKCAKKIMKNLHMSEKEYRKLLKLLRDKLNIVERNLTNKTYDNIDFREVPSKALIKYANIYSSKMNDKYTSYLESVKTGKEKINTNGLFAYEIIRKIGNTEKISDDMYDLMWKNQKDVLAGCNTNVLVMADTSGSMIENGHIPYDTALGLAIYTAERNTGIFKNHFLTFSSQPYLCEIKGKTIKEKIQNIPTIVEMTNIDAAFELLLKTAIDNKLPQEELPSHLLIISDMEFDYSVKSKDGTNFEGWKKSFTEAGYKLPKIIFWNVALKTNGVPVTKFQEDVAMISGFATNILDNLLTLEKYDPIDLMLDKLNVYLGLLKVTR